MDFRLSSTEEGLRKKVEEFVRDELIPLEPEFLHAPDIFEGSRWKSRAKLSRDPEIRRYIEIMAGEKNRRSLVSRRSPRIWRTRCQQRRHDRCNRRAGENVHPI
jgi:hypothetical protein